MASPSQAEASALSLCPCVPIPSAASNERSPASSRALPLIEYWADGSYGVISPTQGVLALVPDSPQWFDWLATLSSFRFLGLQGRLSASRNKGRTSWMAYRRIHGQCYPYGLGQTAHLTMARLEQMAAMLQSHAPSRSSLKPVLLPNWVQRYVSPTKCKCSACRLFPSLVQVPPVCIPSASATLVLYRRPGIGSISPQRYRVHKEEVREGAREASLERLDLAEERVGL